MTTVFLGPVRVPARQFEILPELQLGDDRAVQGIRHRRIDGRIRRLGIENGLDPIEPGLRFRNLRSRRDLLAVEFGELLFVHQPSAGLDDIVLGLELDHGAFGLGGLVAQLLDTVLQPEARAPRRLVFRVELIDDIGVGDRVGDLRRPFRRERVKANLDDVGQSEPGAPSSRLRRTLRPCGGSFRNPNSGYWCNEQMGDPANDGTDQPAARPAEFRVVLQMQILDHGQRDGLGLQDLDLTFDRRAVDRNVAQHRLLLKQLVLARVDDQRRGRGIDRFGIEQIKDAQSPA